MATKAAKLRGRPTLNGTELKTLKAVLADIDARVKKIEQDSALLALKVDMDKSFREIFARLSTLEEQE
jgi:hypothetical protein